MDSLQWFSISIIHPINSAFNTDEEIDELDKIRLLNEGLLDDYETTLGYFCLSRNTITQLNPKVFIPKGKTNKKYYTEIVFENGDLVYSPGKPEVIYSKLNEYYESLPIPDVDNEPQI
jgi:hypothetical protein